MAVYIEKSNDEIQRKLLAEIERLDTQLGLLGQGFWVGFKRRKIEKQIDEAQKKYWLRAYQLGLEAKYSSGSHG